MASIGKPFAVVVWEYLHRFALANCSGVVAASLCYTAVGTARPMTGSATVVSASARWERSEGFAYTTLYRHRGHLDQV